MELESSILGMIGSAVCWIFKPIGFGTIKATVATVMGLVAKEEVVGVFGVLDFEGYDKACRLFLPYLQSSLCSLLCSNRCN